MPFYDYNTNIPQGSDIPAQSAPLFLTNYNSISSILNNDMIGFKDVNNNGGFHRRITFVKQATDPGSAANQVVLYSKASGASTDLFFQRDGVATVTQLTGGGITAGAWAQFDANAMVVNQSFNVSSVGQSGTKIVVNFTRSFANTNYAVSIFPTILNSTDAVTATITNRNTNNVQFRILDAGTITTVVDDVSIIVFGVLA